VTGFLITLGVLAVANVVAFRHLRAVYPRRRRLVAIALLAGLSLFPAIPLVFLRGSPWPFAIARSVTAPAFMLWQTFALLLAAVTAVMGLVHALGRVTGRWRRPWSAWTRVPTSAFIGVFAAIVLVGLWGALVPLQVREEPMPVRDLPAEFDGYRIALMSDLHVGLFTRESRIRRMVAEANATAADMVVLAGDLVDDDPLFLPRLVRWLHGFTAPDGAYAALGNHEIYQNAAAALVARDDLPFRLLVNEAITIRRGEAALRLFGLGEPAAAGTRFGPRWSELAPAGAGEVVAVLAHQPDPFAEAVRRGVHLMMAGHSHGGQFGSRRLHWCLSGLALRWHMGRYVEDGSALFVTTGAGFWVLPIRVGVLPEIVVLRLVPAAPG
jgi:uncharacterized protein